MVRRWFIYILRCPVTRAIKYIGITSVSLHKRLRDHLYNKDHNPEKAQWIAWLHSQGLLPLIIRIDTFMGTRAQAEQMERYWTYVYIKAGHDLLNIKHLPADKKAFFTFLSNYHEPIKRPFSQETELSISA